MNLKAQFLCKSASQLDVHPTAEADFLASQPHLGKQGERTSKMQAVISFLEENEELERQADQQGTIPVSCQKISTITTPALVKNH